MLKWAVIIAQQQKSSSSSPSFLSSTVTGGLVCSHIFPMFNRRLIFVFLAESVNFFLGFFLYLFSSCSFHFLQCFWICLSFVLFSVYLRCPHFFYGPIDMIRCVSYAFHFVSSSSVYVFVFLLPMLRFCNIKMVESKFCKGVIECVFVPVMVSVHRLLLLLCILQIIIILITMI
jgi:hypothetical protein